VVVRAIANIDHLRAVPIVRVVTPTMLARNPNR
jgi:hypothetical protein